MTPGDYFERIGRAALAFSGGTDSAYLLYLALANGCDATAYYVKTQFQPEFEQRDAEAMAEKLGVRLSVIDMDGLDSCEVAENTPSRCYFCKKRIMGAILAQARTDGYEIVMDGTNASDDAEDRPGMKALEEMKIISPLRELGLTKRQIREQSKAAGLFTWSKPAYACLATRIPFGTEITAERLRKIEQGEEALFKMGFSDFRVRMTAEGSARIEVTGKQMEQVFRKRSAVVHELGKLFCGVSLSLVPREDTVNG